MGESIPVTRPFLTAEWRYLAMLNFNVDPGILRPHLPKGVELDTHDGRHFLSLVAFLFLETDVLGLPAFFHRNFEEVNLRFYARRPTGKDSGQESGSIRKMW